MEAVPSRRFISAKCAFTEGRAVKFGSCCEEKTRPMVRHMPSMERARPASRKTHVRKLMNDSALWRGSEPSRLERFFSNTNCCSRRLKSATTLAVVSAPCDRWTSIDCVAVRRRDSVGSRFGAISSQRQYMHLSTPSAARAVPKEAHSATCSPRGQWLHFVLAKRHLLSSQSPSMHFFTAAICMADRPSAPRVRVRMSPGASPPITRPDSFFTLSCTMGRSGLGFSPSAFRTISLDEPRRDGPRAGRAGAASLAVLPVPGADNPELLDDRGMELIDDRGIERRAACRDSALREGRDAALDRGGGVARRAACSERGT